MPPAPAPTSTSTDPQSHLKAEAVARGLEKLAWLMDRAFTIPGTKIHVGLDSLLGLFPGGGDLATGLVQAGLVLTAMAHYKVPKAVAARMATNVLLDIGVGAIPFIGDIFDIGFKANTRNIALLNEVRQVQKQGREVPTGSSIRYMIIVGLVLFLALGLMFVGFAAVVYWLIKAVTPGQA